MAMVFSQKDIQKYIHISKKSVNTFIPRIEQKTRNGLSSLESNSDNRYTFTNNYLNNKQKLLDFISDKKKLSINTCFDHRGAKMFLNGKKEAMKKIELNDNLEETQIRNKKDKNIKNKMNKTKSCTYLINKKNKDNNYINKDKSIIKNNKSEKKKAESEKYLTNWVNNKLKDLKEKINSFDNDYEFKPAPKTHIHKHKKRKQKNKEIKKNNKEIDISISSNITVDSTLFHNKKDYDKYKRFATKDDVIILQDILCELGFNK